MYPANFSGQPLVDQNPQTNPEPSSRNSPQRRSEKNDVSFCRPGGLVDLNVIICQKRHSMIDSDYQRKESSCKDQSSSLFFDDATSEGGYALSSCRSATPVSWGRTNGHPSIAESAKSSQSSLDRVSLIDARYQHLYCEFMKLNQSLNQRTAELNACKLEQQSLREELAFYRNKANTVCEEKETQRQELCADISVLTAMVDALLRDSTPEAKTPTLSQKAQRLSRCLEDLRKDTESGEYEEGKWIADALNLRCKCALPVRVVESLPAAVEADVHSDAPNYEHELEEEDDDAEESPSVQASQSSPSKVALSVSGSEQHHHPQTPQDQLLQGELREMLADAQVDLRNFCTALDFTFPAAVANAIELHVESPAPSRSPTCGAPSEADASYASQHTTPRLSRLGSLFKFSLGNPSPTGYDALD